jgi:ParB/RepB/Spo0J family partition protein
MRNIEKRRQAMTSTEAGSLSSEYRNIAVTELTESTTNPRKAFDEERLDELAASIRTHGVLSPLVVRCVNGHFEIVAGVRRYRAAQRAGLAELPVRVLTLTDAEAQELQIIENVQRTDVHPFEEAQGFRALLDREGSAYTVEKIAAAIAKSASYVSGLCSQQHNPFYVHGLLMLRIMVGITADERSDEGPQHNWRTFRVGQTCRTTDIRV